MLWEHVHLSFVQSMYKNKPFGGRSNLRPVPGRALLKPRNR